MRQRDKSFGPALIDDNSPPAAHTLCVLPGAVSVNGRCAVLAAADGPVDLLHVLTEHADADGLVLLRPHC
jgi:hypothetical protein